ncbi:MAG: hypothetical protein GF398_03635 [Chitinivibrionales bacterium]|nr:hypothetical protein [Chitinivibrionales bacterium]
MDNPVASYYDDQTGSPSWTDAIAWDRVVDMSYYKVGADHFEKFENARDELYAQGGGVLYYPQGTYSFDVPDGPNGRGLMLKEGVVIRGQAPVSDEAAVISYDAAGLRALKTVFNFTSRNSGGPGLHNHIGSQPANASRIGIAWVEVQNGYVHFGFDATDWAASWAVADSWLSANHVNGWGERNPDGTHIMDPFAGDGTSGKYDSGRLSFGKQRFVFGCRFTDAKIHNYALNKANCSTFSSDDESWRFGGIISVYGDHILVGNNVIPQTGSSADNRLCVDVNKQLIGMYRNRCDVVAHTGYYALDVIVRDNWVYNRGNKSFEVSGTWMVVKDNVAHKEFLNGTPTYNSCIDGDGASDYMNRGYDFGGMNVWAHNNQVKEAGSGGNDGEGMLVQRHNEVETFSHSWTDNRCFAHANQASDKGYIAPYDVHVLGLLQLRNKTSGNVGIRKPASNVFADIAIVKNEADDGISGSGVQDFLHDCPPGVPSAPANALVEAVDFGAKITWQDQADNEIGFRVERRIGSGPATTIAYRPRHSNGSTNLDYAPTGAGNGGPCNCAAPAGYDFNRQEWIDYSLPTGAAAQYRVVAINCDDNDAGAGDWVAVGGALSHTVRDFVSGYDLTANLRIGNQIMYLDNLPDRMNGLRIQVFDHTGRTLVNLKTRMRNGSLALLPLRQAMQSGRFIVLVSGDTMPKIVRQVVYVR